MHRFSFILIIAFSLIPSLSFAKGDVYVGDTIPHNLDLKDQNHEMRSFKDLAGEKGIVLSFVRSVDWCPYCQKQLIDLDKSAERFQDFGYNLVAVSYDSPEAMRKFVTQNEPTMTLLSDPRSDSIRAFGILNEEVAKGTVSYGVPHPIVYVIGKDKKVQARFFEQGYEERPSTGRILAKVESLNPPELPPMTMETMGTDPIEPGEEFVEIPQEELPPLILPGVENNIEANSDMSEIQAPLEGNNEIPNVEETSSQIIEEVIDEPAPPEIPEPTMPTTGSFEQPVIKEPSTVMPDEPEIVEPSVTGNQSQEFFESAPDLNESAPAEDINNDETFDVM